MRVLSRNPFGRYDVVRRQVTITSADVGARYATWLVECAFCGRVRWTKNGHPFNYQYGVSPDSGGEVFNARTFCSKQCYDAFFS